MNEIKLTSKEWYDRLVEEGTIIGIPISRIKELNDLLMKEGFDLKSEEDWKGIKLKYFGILEPEEKD